jgi:hypothetical protein
MKRPAPKGRDPRGGVNLHSLESKDRLGPTTLNPACFGQGVTLVDIEKLTLSAADLDGLTLGKADLADLAPPRLRLLAP